MARISSDVRYTEEAFQDQVLDGLQINASEFVDCSFRDCSFVETSFTQCRFVNCAFKHCDFSLCRIPESIFVSPFFDGCKMLGVNWAQAEWPATELGKPLKFTKCTLNHSTFIGLNLKSLQVLDCHVANADFREADLLQADFSGSDLSDSLFLHTNLSQADLSQARNYLIDPGVNTLKNTKFSLPEAMSLLYSMDIILTGGDDDPFYPS